MIFEVILR